MSEKFLTRMGDGERVRMDADEIRNDIREGTADAAKRGGIPELTKKEQERMFEIITDPSRIVSVKPGEEVIVTDDGHTMSFYSGQDGGGVGTPLSRMQAVLTYERACGADTTSMGHSDYSYKPVKPIINFEANDYYNISMSTTAPFFYGAQPNMGLYFQPDGPCPNAAELLPLGKIDEARKTQEDAAEHLTKDLVFVARKLADVGLEGLNFDTSGSAGDADFLAALRAVEQLKAAIPDLPILMGGAGEFIIGMHGEVTYKGKRLAGMYTHDQARIVEEAGADIFGMAVNTVTNKSVQWNLSRATTFLKATTRSCSIPVHANVGMGVCGIPMMEQPPIDSVTRVSKTLVEIGSADGL
ncbi:MAG: [dimethylamine--corrinoid protein] Co-methyltransferase [Desulfobacterales bacterium]|nr:[dimethylamine--corrinoid protein] Co-methyltransferase [Desulfobacterales bacterium]